MKFIVECKKTAIDELTAAWTSADSSGRREITAGAREIDQLLQSDLSKPFGEYWLRQSCSP